MISYAPMNSALSFGELLGDRPDGTKQTSLATNGAGHCRRLRTCRPRGMQTPQPALRIDLARANFTSRNRMLVEWSYRSSSLIGEAVDAIPDDMTRKQVFASLPEIDAKDRIFPRSATDQLQIWDALNDVLKWSRLYGGAVGFIR